MLYAERHRPSGVGLADAVHRTWAVAEKNDWQFSNPRIDTASMKSGGLSYFHASKNAYLMFLCTVYDSATFLLNKLLNCYCCLFSKKLGCFAVNTTSQ